MTKPLPPELSVILVSYGSRADLERLLPTLFAQGLEAEVLVVDNRPGDGTADWLRMTYPHVRVISRSDNPGYAGGNNAGIAEAQGRYVMVLNPDTELHPGALRVLLEAIRAHPQALIGAKLLNPDGTVNAAGNQMHYSGITTCRGLYAPAERYRGLEPVPLLSGAALVASKETWAELGGFDEDYWMYLEDTDLSLRARLRGHPLFSANEALITHHYRLGMHPRKFYYLERNRLFTLFKVYEGRTLQRMAPALLLTELATWGFALLRGPAYLAARWRGYAWLYRHRDRIRQKRAEVQRARVIPDAALLEGTLAQLPFEQLTSPKLAGILDRLTRPLYTLLRPRLERSGRGRLA
ncbi:MULTISPECIES: glycosyltransferase family 2 protein [unclassified Meiothermus]|uniref:glycosyltransferase family 2 protein n=1 Tax=unclassified Meiothermus TaxID=370471 RepID=UPI000D7D17C1|nr:MULTISPECIES: glycosyltransferase family 2 protein [unclassified Meiothermus]PZA06435.1 glycosyltransferase family 2 protein [Meiothermus sp. Pnk-1]RYM36946.1 glycosyltransferase family 2 protein [Meiothermus sp. PNK-Is4]